MKINRVFHKIFQSKSLCECKKVIPPSPIVTYNPSNVTAEEFKAYINWLASNGINKTIIEPDRYVTKMERKLLEKQKNEHLEFRKFLSFLSENNINRTFYC